VPDTPHTDLLRNTDNVLFSIIGCVIDIMTWPDSYDIFAVLVQLPH